MVSRAQCSYRTCFPNLDRHWRSVKSSVSHCKVELGVLAVRVWEAVVSFFQRICRSASVARNGSIIAEVKDLQRPFTHVIAEPVAELPFNPAVAEAEPVQEPPFVPAVIEPVRDNEKLLPDISAQIPEEIAQDPRDLPLSLFVFMALKALQKTKDALTYRDKIDADLLIESMILAHLNYQNFETVPEQPQKCSDFFTGLSYKNEFINLERGMEQLEQDTIQNVYGGGLFCSEKRPPKPLVFTILAQMVNDEKTYYLFHYDFDSKAYEIHHFNNSQLLKDYLKITHEINSGEFYPIRFQQEGPL